MKNVVRDLVVSFSANGILLLLQKRAKFSVLEAPGVRVFSFF